MTLAPWPADSVVCGIASAAGFLPLMFFVARTAGAAASVEWTGRVEQGAILILEGESSLAEMFGFKRGKENVHVTSLADIHSPKLPIVWEKGIDLPVFQLPAGAQVFARERWNNAPLSAGLRRGERARRCCGSRLLLVKARL